MVSLFYGILAFLLIIIAALIRRNAALSRSFDECLAENKAYSAEALPASKFEDLAVSMAQLRTGGLSDKKFFFETVLDCACAILSSGRGSMMTFDEASEELYVSSARNISQDLAEKVRIKPGEGIAGRAFQTGEIIYVSDPSGNPQYLGFEHRPEQKDPFICIPVKTSRRTYAVLNIHLTSSKLRFTDFDLKLLTMLADEAGLIMEINRLKQALNPSAMNKKKSAFAEALDKADEADKKETELRKQRIAASEAARKKEVSARPETQKPAAANVSAHPSERRVHAGRGFSGGFAAAATSHRGFSVSHSAQPEMPDSNEQPVVSAAPGIVQQPVHAANPAVAPAGVQFVPVAPEQYVAAPQMVYVPVQMPAQGGQPATQVFAQIPAGMAQGGMQYIRVMPDQYVQMPAGAVPVAGAQQTSNVNVVPQAMPQSKTVVHTAPVSVPPVQYVEHPMANMPGTAAGIPSGNFATENVEQATEQLMQRFSLNRSFGQQPRRPAAKKPVPPQKKPNAAPKPPQPKVDEDSDIVIDDGSK